MLDKLRYIASEIDITTQEIGLPVVQADNDLFDRIIGLVYTAIAAISLFYVIRGALLYVTHGTEPNAQKEARETIIYALVALVGSSLVFTLIWFVVNSVAGGPQV